MAKRILVEERRLTIGHVELDSPVVQIFETAEDEVARGKVRVDCLMGIGNRENQLPIDITELAVEIKVTHAVDEQKKAELRELGLSTIEINLSELVQIDSTLSLKDIRKAICDTPSNITWIDYEESKSIQLPMVFETSTPIEEDPESLPLDDEPSLEKTSPSTDRKQKLQQFQRLSSLIAAWQARPTTKRPSTAKRKRKKPFNSRKGRYKR